MMLANYHTHTVRCKHAKGTEREYIEAAIKEGFKTLGFSDHTPQPYPKGFTSGIRMDMDQIGDYTESLVKLRDEYKDQIQILIGYEVEYTLKFFDTLLKELRQYPLDYIIQGQHFVKDEVEGIYVGRPNESEEKLKEYVDFTIEGMKTGLFTYLAHPDLFNFAGPDDIYQKHMRRIFETSLDLNIPLEVNFLGFIEGRHYPSKRFFELTKEYNPHIVLGCDAHAPEQLKQAEHVLGMSEFLKECNIEVTNDNIVTIRNCK